MKAPARLWLWIGGGLLVLVVFTAVLQAINNLIWQLSYLLPAWLVGPFTLLLFGGGALLIARVAWPWLEGWRRKRSGSTSAGATSAAPPSSRQEAAQQQLQAVDQLQERIRAYWAERRYDVIDDVVPSEYDSKMRSVRYDVRSALVNGLPRKSRAA